MPDFVTMTCPSCASKLQISRAIDRFACASCGEEFIVNRTGGVVGLVRSLESFQKIQVGVDKTASELAIARLTKDVEQLSREYSTLDGEDETGTYVFAGGLLFVSWLSFANDGATLGFFLGVPGVLMIVALIIGGINRGSKKEELFNKMHQKQAEIAKHKKIIDI